MNDMLDGDSRNRADKFRPGPTDDPSYIVQFALQFIFRPIRVTYTPVTSDGMRGKVFGGIESARATKSIRTQDFSKRENLGLADIPIFFRRDSFLRFNGHNSDAL